MTAGRASERSDERKREVTGTVRFNPCDGVDADSRAVAGYSRDQRPTSRVREAGFGPQTCPVTCAFGFVVLAERCANHLTISAASLEILPRLNRELRQPGHASG
jgi:hypothetical protein